MIFDTNLKTKDRKRLQLSGFKGVDTANAIYDVDKRRATAMRNFISINGCNHKRPGWRQIARFKDAEGRDLPINGYFDFYIGNERYKIVYAGKIFFIYDDSTDRYINLLSFMEQQGQNCPNKVDPARLKDQKIQMFVYDDRAYFIGCGDYLVFGIYDGRPEIRRVLDDEKTFVPRTTTNIPPNEAEVDANDQAIIYPKRQTDRDVNVLTRYRINELIGSAQASEDAERTYNLDCTEIDAKNFTVTLYDYDEATGETTNHTLRVGGVDTDRVGTESVTRNLVVGDDLAGKTIKFTPIRSFGAIQRFVIDKESDARPETVFVDAGSVKIKAVARDDTWNIADIIVAIDESETVCGVAERRSPIYRYSISWSETEINIPQSVADATVTALYKADAGYFDIKAYLLQLERTLLEDVEGTTETWGYIDFYAGKLTFIKPARSIAGEPNIKVKFAKLDENASESVLSCRFGAFFGVHGNTNTLFLSGNKDKKNYDFWSSPEDFTYFPSGNYCEVGTSNNAIMGYLRLGDDSLAILKSESRYEPTLYIRTGTATSVDSTTSEVSEGYFVTSGKFITQGAVAENTAYMLAGDAIFLSKHGIYGITISDNSITDEQRVARERSRFINELLKKHETLSAATAITYDNKYYLAIDGAVYVADARYKFTGNGDMADTYNYEWWVWDNCPIRNFYEIDNKLCFGTDDGRLCVFDNEYTDRTFEEIASVTHDTDRNCYYPDMSMPFRDTDLCYFKGAVYRLLFDADEIRVEDGKIYFNENALDRIAIGQAVYADTVGSSGLTVHTKYIIDEIEPADLYFRLSLEDGTSVAPTASGFRLLCNMDGEILRFDRGIDEFNRVYLQVKNYYDRQVYRVATYNGENEYNLGAKLFRYTKTNVVAEWYTPVMDMGANDYVKQLLQVTIATEQITNGNVAFGWETKSVDSLVNLDAKGLDVFDFGNLNFDRFAFDTGFSTSYSRKVKAGFNFIIFRFVSDNEYDCCIYSFTVSYKLNRLNKGVF